MDLHRYEIYQLPFFHVRDYLNRYFFFQLIWTFEDYLDLCFYFRFNLKAEFVDVYLFRTNKYKYMFEAIFAAALHLSSIEH